MADRQTIGGYVKPATIISVDLPLMAQLVPESSVRFEAVSLWEARELAITAEYRLQKWISDCFRYQHQWKIYIPILKE